MSSGAYVVAVLLLAATAGSLAGTARLLRRYILPDWVGSPARVAEIVLGVGTSFLLAEVLGSVGLLRRGPFVTACLTVAVVSAWVLRRTEARRTVVASPTRPRQAPRALHGGPLPPAVAAAPLVLVAIRWLHQSDRTIHVGFLDYDTLWYHLPFAARFFQNGALTGLHYVSNGPTTFYPQNGELAHTLGMVLFSHDVLSAVLNLGWLGLALLSGWCIGRPFALAPVAAVAVALICSWRVTVNTQAGTANTDIVALALFLAAVAVMVNGAGSRRALGVTALAAGLAVGTRLNYLAPVIVLGVVAVAAQPRSARLAGAASWIGCAFVGGGYWFVRNLVAVHNPLPWFGLRVPGLLTLPSTTAPSDCGRTSLAHYLKAPGLLEAYIVPQVSVGLWLMVALAFGGTAAALTSKRRPLRALAVVAAASAVAYVFTPATAGGADARCFTYNTRFAFPAIALGLLLLPLALATTRARALLATAVMSGLAIVLSVVRVPVDPIAILAAVAAAGIVTVISVIGWDIRHSLPRAVTVAGVVAIGMAAVVVGWGEQRTYFGNRWSRPDLYEPTDGIRHLNRLSHVRIAVAGLLEHYVLYDFDLSNRVDYPAARIGPARFAPYRTCTGWLLALNRGRYDFVVTAREGPLPPPEAAWTGRYPGAVRLFASPPGATAPQGAQWSWQVFRLVRRPSALVADACSVRRDR